MKAQFYSTANRNRSRALTLVEVLVVVVVGLLLISLPIYLGAKRAWAKMVRIDCAHNLSQFGIDARIWAGDHSNSFPMATSTNQGGTKEVAADVWRNYLAMTNELANLKLLVCPADSRKPATSVASLRNENISYFLGLDSNETTPQAFLAGDRNLTTNGVAVGPGLLTLTSNSILGFTKDMHVEAGNVLFSDGSVQQVNGQRLQSQLSSGGLPTNRLVIP
jgi:type II secretory pathway pseudopilin PulG